MTQKTKKAFVKSWGCQMNVYDADRMIEVIGAMGYAKTQSADEADLIILNTCHIREKATEKLFSELGRLHDVQLEREAKGQETLIAVAGCVAQAEGAEIQKRAPYVSMVFGPQTYHLLPEMIAKLAKGARTVLNTEFPEEPKFDFLPQRNEKSPLSAFLAVQEGCDKFCSYCVVPYTRGAEYTRPASAVMEEARQLVEAGAHEITLLGQNVNAYDDDGVSLAELIERLAGMNGVKRLRYMTSHPVNMKDDLIAAHRDIPQLMPFLHLPVQSGSDKILEAMNRKHKAADYLRQIEKIRKARPDIALSSDFIVGFPGETKQDFEDTVKIVHEVGFAQSFSFKYSARGGTPAAVMKNQISEAVKDERLGALQEVLHAQQEAFNNGMRGKTLTVLLETAGKKPGQLRGKSPYLQTVHVMADAASLGDEADVEINDVNLNGLFGKLKLGA